MRPLTAPTDINITVNRWAARTLPPGERERTLVDPGLFLREYRADFRDFRFCSLAVDLRADLRETIAALVITVNTLVGVMLLF